MKKYPFSIKARVRLDLETLALEIDRGKIKFQAENLSKLFESVLSPGIENVKYGDFKRGDDKVKAYITVACALYHASKLTSGDGIGVLDWGVYGCHEQNKRYFEEYLLAGKRAHGRLFVATLPTTPVCECAISLGLTGPLYYTDTLGNIDDALSDAAILIDDAPAKRVFFFNYTPDRLTAFALAPGETLIHENATTDSIYKNSEGEKNEFGKN